MRLEKLGIQGFKPFRDKTILEFPDKFTAIVGPNGSGKSNIVDSICFVLGKSRGPEGQQPQGTDIQRRRHPSEFGGVIFCRAGRQDIRSLRDLRGRSFMAVEETSLGRWRAAWREFHALGIDPYRDFSPLTFAGTHDAVVYAVLNGTADGGTVRTDTLARMQLDGLIDRDSYRVLNQQESGGFPFMLTRLYPEWPIARLRSTPEELSEKVVIALLSLGPDEPAAMAAKIAGWTIPLDYGPVHELLKRP